MSRILMLLQKLSIFQIIVSISLFAQYSHFPLTSLEFDGIESEKFPNFSSELENLSDIIDSSIFDSGTTSYFHSDLIEPSPALKTTNAQSDEPATVDVGISPKGSLKQNSNFAYIQNLADAQTIISPDSTDLISDIIYFLKDLFDDDGNYSEENWLKSDYALNGSKVPEIHYERMTRDRSIANTTISSFGGTLTVPEFQKYLETHTHPNHLNQGAKSSSNKQYFDNLRGDIPPSFQATSTLYSDVQESREFAAFNVFELENPQSLPPLQRFTERQRRTSSTYYWEMTKFAGTDNDILSLGNHSGQNLTIIIRPLESGTVGSGDDNSTDGVIGAPSDYPGYIGSDQSFSNVIQFNNSIHRPATISVDASALEYYINYYYGDWGIVANGNNYDIMYYSQAPEPSTYVMTGALLCFIGFNQKSRNSLKKIFKMLSNKLNLPSYLEKLTRFQSHS
jgi:hypothetical protein